MLSTKNGQAVEASSGLMCVSGGSLALASSSGLLDDALDDDAGEPGEVAPDLDGALCISSSKTVNAAPAVHATPAK